MKKVLTRQSVAARIEDNVSIQKLSDGTEILIRVQGGDWASDFLKSRLELGVKASNIPTEKNDDFVESHLEVFNIQKIWKRSILLACVLDHETRKPLYSGEDDELLTGLDLDQINDQFEAVEEANGFGSKAEKN